MEGRAFAVGRRTAANDARRGVETESGASVVRVRMCVLLQTLKHVLHALWFEFVSHSFE